MNQKQYIEIYPIYLDSEISLGEGRKYSITSSISKPTYKELKQALGVLNLNFIEESSKRHPKDHKETGRFKIEKIGSKKEIVLKIAEKVKELRKQAESKIKGTGNFLNLVPKSKQKSKKPK